MTRLTPYRLQKLRQRMREEAVLWNAAATRHRDLAASLPAPSLDELRALEKGEVPMPLEAHWSSVLSEQALWLSGAAAALEAEAGRTRGFLNLFWYPGRHPSARRIAHLRGSLRGRTLPEDFLPPCQSLPLSLLLFGQDGVSPAGAELVTDLLIQGYRWER